MVKLKEGAKKLICTTLETFCLVNTAHMEEINGKIYALSREIRELKEMVAKLTQSIRYM